MPENIGLDTDLMQTCLQEGGRRRNERQSCVVSYIDDDTEASYKVILFLPSGSPHLTYRRCPCDLMRSALNTAARRFDIYNSDPCGASTYNRAAVMDLNYQLVTCGLVSVYEFWRHALCLRTRHSSQHTYAYRTPSGTHILLRTNNYRASPS